MARLHGKELKEFFMYQVKGKNGTLSYEGTEVYSYSIRIAKVDREKRVVTLLKTKFSTSTSRHQHSVRNGIPYGWELVEVDRFDS
jgi:hypothetical protein